MSNKELLELAAKAAGIDAEWREITHSRVAEFGLVKHTVTDGFWSAGKWWNPLTDDGDALRLAVKLDLLTLDIYNYEPDEWRLDPYAATRRAIVRAAAGIGKETK